MSSPSVIAMRDDSRMRRPGPVLVGRPPERLSRQRKNLPASPRMTWPLKRGRRVSAYRGPLYVTDHGVAKTSGRRRSVREETRRKDWPTHSRASRDRSSPSPARQDRTAPGHDGGGTRNNVKNARTLRKSFEELAGRNTAHEAVMTTQRIKVHRLLPPPAGESTFQRRPYTSARCAIRST